MCCSGLPDRHWLLGIGKSLLWELIRQGRVPVLRLGQRTLTRTAPRHTGKGR